MSKHNKNPSQPKPQTESVMLESVLLVETLAAPEVQDVVIEEAKDGGRKKYILRGHFGNYDEATFNKRKYPKSLWEREILRLEGAMKDRRLYGEQDHPESAKTSFSRVACLITKLWLDAGKVMGEAEILDTYAGSNIQRILDAKGKVGVSSRGYGSVKPGGDGYDIVQDNYQLVTFDIVVDPAAGAYPQPFMEWKDQVFAGQDITASVLEQAFPEASHCITEAAVKERVLAVEAQWQDKIDEVRVQAEESAMARLQEAFSAQLVERVAVAKKEVLAEAVEQVRADPEVAGAKIALDAIKQALLPFILPEDLRSEVKVATEQAQVRVDQAETLLGESRLEVKRLAETTLELEASLREVGYRLFAEQSLGGNTKGIEMLGDIDSFASPAEIAGKAAQVKAKLAEETAGMTAAEKSSLIASNQDLKLRNNTIQKKLDEALALVQATKLQESKSAASDSTVRELTQQLREAAERADQGESMVESLQTKMVKQDKLLSSLGDKLDSTERALEAAIAAQEQTAGQLYAEQKLTNHPKAPKIRSILESSGANTRQAIDAVVEGFRAPTRDPEAQDTIRARIRKLTKGGVEQVVNEEENLRTPSVNKDLASLGITTTDFRRLSGPPGKGK